jgi:hypothetical protein
LCPLTVFIPLSCCNKHFCQMLLNFIIHTNDSMYTSTALLPANSPRSWCVSKPTTLSPMPLVWFTS